VVFLPDTLHLLREESDYQIHEAEKNTKRVAIDIFQRTSIISVFKDKLEVTSRDLVSIINSSNTTRALFSVRTDSTSQIYLEQGKISFPENPEADSIKAKQVARFSHKKMTQIFTPGLANATALASFIKFNYSTIWKTPW